MSKDKPKAYDRYTDKMSTLRIRYPSEETCGVNYTELMRAKAEEYGLINTRGEGSINAYILRLIENDLGIDMKKGMGDIAPKSEE